MTIFKRVKDLGGFRRNYNGVINYSNGKKIALERIKVVRWEEHFNNVPTRMNRLNSMNGPIRIDLTA